MANLCKCGCGNEVERRSEGQGRQREYLPGHNAYKKKPPRVAPPKKPRARKRPRGPVTLTATCECGCGQQFTYTHVGGNHRRFIEKHSNAYKNELRWQSDNNRRTSKVQGKPGEQTAFLLCACGCGELITTLKGNRKFVKGHQRRGALFTDSHREKIGASVKKRYEEPEYRDKMAKIHLDRFPSITPSKPVLFGGIVFRSTWEATRAAQLTEAGVPFEYEKHRLEYIKSDGSSHQYIPDFWLPTLGLFEEVKGFFREKDKDKMRRALNNNPGVVLRVIQTTQEWGRLLRGKTPDASRFVELTGWQTPP